MQQGSCDLHQALPGIAAYVLTVLLNLNIVHAISRHDALAAGDIPIHPRGL